MLPQEHKGNEPLMFQEKSLKPLSQSTSEAAALGKRSHASGDSSRSQKAGHMDSQSSLLGWALCLPLFVRLDKGDSLVHDLVLDASAEVAKPPRF